MTVHRMHGGLRLRPFKAESTRQPILVLPCPEVLVLPLRQHAGSPARALVQVGERVHKYQALARADGHISAHLHASAAGTVVAIENRPWPHPSGHPGPCIVLRTDELDAPPAGLPPIEDWGSVSAETLRARIRDAGIVGLGGAGFPTHVKLVSNPMRVVHTLILNGAECEPYISCDDMLVRERAQLVINGARIMMRALDAARCVVAIEQDKPEALAALEAALQQAGADGIAVVVVPALYPQGGERQLVQALTGQSAPPGGLPMDIGIVCQNVGTAAAVHRAVVEGVPLVSRIVTVTGPGIMSPRNIEALIGTPVRALLEACDGYRFDDTTLTMGGPMMGFTLSGPDVPVVKAMNCVLVRAPEVVPEPQPCIRCTECASVCPEDLLPQQLHWFAQAKDHEQAVDHRLFDCIECGCCDAVCPSHIPLVSEFRWAKGAIRAQAVERDKAELAKRRFEAREQRLAAERDEREARLRRKQDPAAIEAALARIRAGGEG